MSTISDSFLIDQNLLEMLDLFGLEKISKPHYSYYLLNTKVPDPLFNLICLPQLESIDDIEEMHQLFKKQKTPFCWWIDETKVSQEVLNYFNTKAYTFFGDVAGMILDLNDHKTFSVTPNPFYLKQVKKIDEFKEWIHVLAQSFQLSSAAEKMYLDRLSPYLEKEDQFMAIGAWKEGKLVTTASLFISKNIAGFYNGSTLENFRNQGGARILGNFGLHLLQERGIRKAVMHTSPLSTSLAQKFHFQKLKNYKLYLSIKD